ncbi:MAG: DNA polymerase III subunit beta [Clostridia bacterium]|jgi:DNA polymerase-3 subunit beta|nr:DNA polymerase III subunit beta [Clostridia bacterium]
MKFSCPKEKLLKAIQIVQRAVSSKSTIPNLTGILLEALEDKLIFRATDREILIQFELPLLSIERTGQALLSARYLSDLVRRLPDTNITVEQQQPEQLFLFRYGKSETQLIGMDPSDYPQLPVIDLKQKIQLEAGKFRQVINQVSSAAATDSLRPIFSGIYMENTGGQSLNVVATDTHRLAYSSIKLPEENQDKASLSLIVPHKTLMEVTRLLDDDETVISIMVGSNQVIFKFDSTTIISRIIEGKFPNYQQVIPEKYSTRIKVHTQSFFEGVDRATLLAQDKSKIASSVLKIATKGDTLILEARSQEIGRAYEEIPIYLEGEDVEIKFNGRYMLDALKVIESEEVYFDLTGNLSPGVFRPADGKDYLYLILPVRSGI